MDALRDRFYRLLRWSERYTKTDMVYLATNGSWLNLNFMFVSVCSLLLSIGFANLLPKEVFGTYQYVLAIAAFFSALTFSGFNTAITQAVAQGKDGVLRASIKPQIRWNIIPTIGAVAFSIYYFVFGNSVLGIGVLLVAITLPFVNTFNAYTAFLYGKDDFKRASIYMILGNGFYYALMGIALVFSPTALMLLGINLFTTAGAAVLFYVRTLAIYNPPKISDPSTTSYARHLSIINVLSLASNQIDNVLVFHYLGPVTLAQYSLATLLPERAGGVFKSVASSALPRFSRRSIEQIRGTLKIRLVFLVLAVFLVIAGYAVCAPFIFSFLYPAYLTAVPYSQFYAFTLLSVIGGIISSALSAHKKVKELYALSTVVPVFQISAQVIGVILWGLWGLIAAKIVSAITVSLASAILIARAPDA